MSQNGSEPLVVGIDLGTSSSRIGVWRDGGVTIIPDARGCLFTPTCVAFTDDGVLVGHAAYEQMERNLENTFQGPQRLIGSTFENPWIRWYMRTWPGKVKKSSSDTPLIRVNDRRLVGYVRPEEIVAHVLVYLKGLAEDYLRDKLVGVALTIPSRLGTRQREALLEACQMAQMNVVHLIRSPTAAAVAYSLCNPMVGKRHTLVCDMGATYINFVILSWEDDQMTEISFDSHYWDLDGTLAEFATADILSRMQVDTKRDLRVQHRVRVACEAAKKRLSQHGLVPLRCEVSDGVMYDAKITRIMFEDITKYDMINILEPLGHALETCGLSRADIDMVLMVGGVARIPRMRRYLLDYFYCKAPTEVKRPESAPVLGASCYAAMVAARERGQMVPEELRRIEVRQADASLRPNGGALHALDDVKPLQSEMVSPATNSAPSLALYSAAEGCRSWDRFCRDAEPASEAPAHVTAVASRVNSNTEAKSQEVGREASCFSESAVAAQVEEKVDDSDPCRKVLDTRSSLVPYEPEPEAESEGIIEGTSKAHSEADREREAAFRRLDRTLARFVSDSERASPSSPAQDISSTGMSEEPFINYNPRGGSQLGAARLRQLSKPNPFVPDWPPAAALPPRELDWAHSQCGLHPTVVDRPPTMPGHGFLPHQLLPPQRQRQQDVHIVRPVQPPSCSTFGNWFWRAIGYDEGAADVRGAVAQWPFAQMADRSSELTFG